MREGSAIPQRPAPWLQKTKAAQSQSHKLLTRYLDTDHITGYCYSHISIGCLCSSLKDSQVNIGKKQLQSSHTNFISATPISTQIISFKANISSVLSYYFIKKRSCCYVHAQKYNYMYLKKYLITFEYFAFCRGKIM